MTSRDESREGREPDQSSVQLGAEDERADVVAYLRRQARKLARSGRAEASLFLQRRPRHNGVPWREVMKNGTRKPYGNAGPRLWATREAAKRAAEKMTTPPIGTGLERAHCGCPLVARAPDLRTRASGRQGRWPMTDAFWSQGNAPSCTVCHASIEVCDSWLGKKPCEGQRLRDALTRVAYLEATVKECLQLAADEHLLAWDGFAVLQAAVHDGIRSSPPISEGKP